MVDLTIKQACSLWAELEDARRGENGYGGKTAEIYAYTLQTRNPTVEAFPNDGGGTHAAEGREEQAMQAGENLAAVCELFLERYPKVAIRFEGYQRAMRHIPIIPFAHRIHMEVIDLGSEQLRDSRGHASG
jgi:hypothetical protein